MSALIRANQAISYEQLTVRLAEGVLGWKTASGRYIRSGRNWLPQWRFQPFTKVEDAFRLLDAAAASCTLTLTTDGDCSAKVRVRGCTGSANGRSKPAVITMAIARAVGLASEVSLGNEVEP